MLGVVVRVFIGFFVPDVIKEYVASIGRELGDGPLIGKAVERANIHVCLSFLGDIEESSVVDVKDALLRLSSINRARVKVGALRAIPNAVRPRALVIGLDDYQGLENITKSVKDAVGGDMKPPHITVCRVKKVEDAESLMKVIEKYNSCDLEFEVREICLIKSVLCRKGPVYEVLEKFGLI